MMTELCKQFRIKHHNSTPYHPKMNGVVEVANKNIKKTVQKMVVTYKDWHDMLSYTLHGYRTSIQTSTRATPYSLVYDTEVVLSAEVEIPSVHPFWMLKRGKPRKEGSPLTTTRLSLNYHTDPRIKLLKRDGCCLQSLTKSVLRYIFSGINGLKRKNTCLSAFVLWVGRDSHHSKKKKEQRRRMREW
ncbi:hypothetical protein CR513_15945, partial [Mucuna pruriens]